MKSIRIPFIAIAIILTSTSGICRTLCNQSDAKKIAQQLMARYEHDQLILKERYLSKCAERTYPFVEECKIND